LEFTNCKVQLGNGFRFEKERYDIQNLILSLKFSNFEHMKLPKDKYIDLIKEIYGSKLYKSLEEINIEGLNKQEKANVAAGVFNLEIMNLKFDGEDSNDFNV
jgi:hypothetical protein